MKQGKLTVIGHYGMSLLMDVDHFPAVGETVEGMNLQIEPGGKGYNQAIAASRLGADVNFITAVGGDDFGSGCERDLSAEGVTGRYVIRFPELKSAYALVANSAAKASEVYVYPGAIRSVEPKHIAQYEDVIKNSALLLLQNEISVPSLETAISLGARYQVEMIYNPAPAREMPRHIFEKVSVITPNETEAAIMAGLDPSEPLDIDAALRYLHGLGVPNVIITLGGNGSCVSTPDGRWHIRPLPGDVVSTTGAGDCSNAALAVRYLETGDIIDSAVYASVASGLQVQREGVIANLPYKEETDEKYVSFGRKLIGDT